MSESQSSKPSEEKQVSHTPGPWHVDPDDGCIKASDGTHVVCLGHDYDQGGMIGAVHLEPWDRDAYALACAANERLIAAAPDLLEALKLCLRQSNTSTMRGNETWDAARAAIAKAEGRS